MSADGQTPEPPVTPIDMLLPGAWRSTRPGRHSSPDSADASAEPPEPTEPPVALTPRVRQPLTLELPLSSLFEPVVPVGDDLGAPDVESPDDPDDDPQDPQDPHGDGPGGRPGATDTTGAGRRWYNSRRRQGHAHSSADHVTRPDPDGWFRATDPPPGDDAGDAVEGGPALGSSTAWSRVQGWDRDRSKDLAPDRLAAPPEGRVIDLTVSAAAAADADPRVREATVLVGPPTQREARGATTEPAVRHAVAPTSERDEPPADDRDPSRSRRSEPDVAPFWLEDIEYPLIRTAAPMPHVGDPPSIVSGSTGAVGPELAPVGHREPDPPMAPAPGRPERTDATPTTPVVLSPEPQQPYPAPQPEPLVENPAPAVAVDVRWPDRPGATTRPVPDSMPAPEGAAPGLPGTLLPAVSPPLAAAVPTAPNLLSALFDGTSRPAPFEASSPPATDRGGADRPPRRVRPQPLLGGLVLAVLVVGLALPFVLDGFPFGSRDGSVTVAEPTTTPTAPTDGAANPTSGVTATGTAARTTTGRPTSALAAATTSAPAVPSTTRVAPAPSTTTRTTRTTTRTTTVPPTTTTPPQTTTTTRTSSPTTTQPSTRPGEVFVDLSRYLGRPAVNVKNEMRELGLTPIDDYVDNTRKPVGTVLDIRPSGWVRDGSNVRVSIAAS